MNQKEKKPIETEGFSNVAVPTDCMDMVNMYGTYNIQPTSEHAHEYPAIAQGLSRKAVEENRKARDRWKQQQAKRAQKETH